MAHICSSVFAFSFSLSLTELRDLRLAGPLPFAVADFLVFPAVPDSKLSTFSFPPEPDNRLSFFFPPEPGNRLSFLDAAAPPARAASRLRAN